MYIKEIGEFGSVGVVVDLARNEQWPIGLIFFTYLYVLCVIENILSKNESDLLSAGPEIARKVDFSIKNFRKIDLHKMTFIEAILLIFF